MSFIFLVKKPIIYTKQSSFRLTPTVPSRKSPQMFCVARMTQPVGESAVAGNSLKRKSFRFEYIYWKENRNL